MYSTISRRIRSPMKEAMPKVKVKATRADAVHVLPSSAKSGRIRTPLKEALPVVKVKPHDASLENSWAASPRELQHVTASRALLWPWSTQLDDGRGVVGYVGNTVSQRLQLRRASATPDPTQQGKLSKSASTSLLPARQSRATSGARSSLTDLRPRGLGEKASLSGWGRQTILPGMTRRDRSWYHLSSCRHPRHLALVRRCHPCEFGLDLERPSFWKAMEARL